MSKTILRKMMFAGVGLMVLVNLFWFTAATLSVRRIRAAEEERALGKDIAVAMLTARRREKDFLLRDLQNPQFFETGSTDTLAAHAVAVAALREASQRIAPYQESEVAHLDRLINNYEQAFSALVAAQRRKGFKDWGIEGEWRATIHDVETSLDGGGSDSSTSGLTDLMVTLLTLRRHEKDYLLRGEERYVDRVGTTLTDFATQARTVLGPNSEPLLDALDRYRDRFNAYLAMESEIGLTEEEGLRGEMRTAIHEIEPVVDMLVQEGQANAERAAEQLTVISIGIFVLALGIGIGLFGLLARIITSPLHVVSQAAGELASGDLRLQLDQKLVQRSDEIGELTRSFSQMNDSLNDVLTQINSAVDQVSSGAGQVAQASQSLSQGATEQASSLEEVTASLTQVSSQARQNSDNATEASSRAKASAETAASGNTQMQDLVAAMTRINESSEEIKKVVKVIDDIAFQINLLALNANVEAARAGKYGKGFAVVADEVRNLAVRSAQAVKETTTMVEESIKNMEAGTTAAGATATQLQAIVEGSSKVADFLNEIALASREQAEGVAQINGGLEQIDQVTQANTASAEQSAAAAEELASQAKMLQGLVARFKLAANGNGATVAVGNGAQGATHYTAGGGNGGNGGNAGNQTRQPAPATTAVTLVDAAGSRTPGSQPPSPAGTDPGPVDPKQLIKLDDSEFDKF